MANVVLEDVHKSWGATHVVKGVSLKLESGSFLSLLGPSGCGKTTTLRMIAGLEAVDRGTIHLETQLVDGPGVRVAPERRELGMVFQSYAVWPHRSVRENVAYPLVLRRLPATEIATRVKEALDWVRLGALADRMPSQLSGGQLQRVAIARALVAQPKVLLLDEPLSNLDMALREELRAEIAALRARLGTTMIFVTHDQHEALALSDRIAVMNKGVIEQLDDPQQLYASPNTPFVAGFVGGANLLEGRIDGSEFLVAGVRFPIAPSSTTGDVTIAARPEAIELGGGAGPELKVAARLFLGASFEYRLTLGENALRVISPRGDWATGQSVRVALRSPRIYPR